MADLKLDTATHDIEIQNGDLVILDGIEAIRQDLLIRLQFFAGEWFLDARIGMPYYQRVLGQKPNESVVRTLFRQAILATPGVVAINDLDVSYDGATRSLAVIFRATTEDGPLVFEAEFIIP